MGNKGPQSRGCCKPVTDLPTTNSRFLPSPSRAAWHKQTPRAEIAGRREDRLSATPPGYVHIIQMHIEEAKSLLGFPPDSHPSVSQVKAAYKTKVWDTHPDRFPPHQRSGAEHQFKLVTHCTNTYFSGVISQFSAFPGH
ncbi:hypothetical protein M9H77_05806 [Catharanthus roseus]|uniref:Uncharacterized protein n=1 Tax=Catharanthus roseus TaxID=4058 RepID=A0ACC0BQC7_CATRO|nr:hypothetical protein M9H77_05806 [Catharanthus roseus]